MPQLFTAATKAPRRLALTGAALALAAVIAGCGSTGSTGSTNPPASPKASPSASVKTKGLTLAEASSPSYTAQFPLVACSTLSPSAQAAWAPLLVGSSVGKCAPADFLTNDIPTVGVKVDDKDSSVSQSEANAYGKALLTTLAWEAWAGVDDSPNVLPIIGQSQGPNAGNYQALENGARLMSSVPGNSTYPDSITLVSLTAADKTLMANTTESFALIVDYAAKGYTFVLEPATGQPTKKINAGAPTPGVYDGTIASNQILGTYLQVQTYGQNCSTGPAQGLCEEAG